MPEDFTHAELDGKRIVIVKYEYWVELFAELLRLRDLEKRRESASHEV